MSEGRFIVIDVGKTLSKLTLWSLDGRMISKVTRSNALCQSDGRAVLDVFGIGDWITETLPQLADEQRISGIIPVAHGAGVAAICGDRLAFPPLDYEQSIPEDVVAAYRKERDPFAETGSPPLPHGLNMGVQLHWLGGRLGGAKLLPWAQYWSWFLSGVATTEVSSLGCHSDLWNPVDGDFSTLAKKRGWADMFAPMAKAGAVIGKLRRKFGLGDEVPVYAGVHDSNAALIAARGFPEIEGGEATVLSTGTWFIAMRTGAPLPSRGGARDGGCQPGTLSQDQAGRPHPNPVEPLGSVRGTDPSTPEGEGLAPLPEARDCLVNVDAFGQPVPSARFMGGREIELLGSRIDLGEDQQAMLDALPIALESGPMILPGFVSGCGPFPDRVGEVLDFTGATRDEQRAAIALYVALVADTSLDLIGAKEWLLIEGRFASCTLFARALATLRPDTKVYTSAAEADVSFGALRLIDPSIRPQGSLTRVLPLEADLFGYQQRWNEHVLQLSSS